MNGPTPMMRSRSRNDDVAVLPQDRCAPAGHPEAAASGDIGAFTAMLSVDSARRLLPELAATLLAGSELGGLSRSMRAAGAVCRHDAETSAGRCRPDLCYQPDSDERHSDAGLFRELFRMWCDAAPGVCDRLGLTHTSENLDYASIVAALGACRTVLGSADI